ncbi:MAG TPA: TonB-dependent receptor [Acidobacteriaceae bacterium]|nr:TonB-dependent receptor [Acidobacteriaceae bacterium]
MTKRCCAAIAFVFLLVFAANSPAQTTTTSLRGVIRDPSGAVIPGAKVSIYNPANGQKFTATSDSSGTYIFASIPPASYTITVQASGFASQSKVATLLVSQPATVSFTMTLKAVSQVVNVSAEAETLNTTDASLGNAMGNTLIQALPSETRNVPDLLSLQPGVLYLPPTLGASESNPSGDSRSGAVNGVRSDQGNVTIDGVDDNDQLFGYAFTGVLRETQDAIDEFRVTTGNSNADEGGSAGAQVSMVTKSGTNQYHGAAYEYNRPTFTVANDWFNKQAELESGYANVPGKLIRNIFGADVGGPILKNKLFFFGNYEGTRKAEDQEVVQTVPTALYDSGELQYPGTILSVAQVTALDAGCQVCNSAQYPPGPGPDPHALSYFKSMPAANGTVEGDGLNEGSYAFPSPNPQTLNTSLARIDYTPNDRHRMFVHGQLQKDTTGATEQFPGQGPSSVYEDNTKGIIAGDTWSISPNMVNDIRYGYIRQGYSNRGLQTTDLVDFRFLSTTTAETPTNITSVPVNNIVDNFNLNHGKHDFQFGVNLRFIHMNQSTNANSFNGGSSNPYWLGGTPPGYNAVPTGFQNSYVIAYGNLVGAIPSVTNNYNYRITSATSGSLLGDGAPIVRNFASVENEYYLQDAWQALPNLMITFGIRHTILSTPWETSGQQVAPTIDTHTWYQQREAAALQGQIYEPALEFSPTGPYYGKPGYWPQSNDNIAPRLAIAYSPNQKTSIRAGFGMYYDHYGEALVNAFDQHGSYGVSSNITNPAGVYTSESSPRFVSRTALPFSNGTAPATSAFPYTPPQAFAITWGLDSKIKTPYTEAFNLSVQHQFAGGWTLETDYVGTLGRHLLQSLDLAEPVDFVDPQGGGDYYAAGDKLSRLVDLNGGNYGFITNSMGAPTGSVVNVPKIQYFEDMFPWMANFDYAGESATQAIYDDEWAPFRSNLGATTALSDLDFYCFSGSEEIPYPCPANFQSRFWQSQFSSLYALSSIGMSYYNSAQITLQHPFSHGLELQVSYTFSHSIDMGSDAERSTEFSTSGSGFSFSDILNTWKPYLNRSSSDFDTRHLVTLDWVYEMPFGHGRAVGGNVNRFVNAFVGGWQWSGINRITSGLPFSLFEPGWTTDWQIESYGVETAPIKMRRYFDSNGNPQFFANPDAINDGLATGSPERLPYPGEAGERNNFRGDGIFDIDSGLTKSWHLNKLREGSALKFDWEIYNVTNTVRFDPASIGAGLTGGNLGIASTELSQPRVMQFALRYDF